MNIPHIPVLLNEVLGSFGSMSGHGVFVDCTLGYGGHSSAILERYPNLRLVGIDRDQEALDFSRERLREDSDRVRLIRGDFATLLPALGDNDIVGVLADFGVSSLQLDKPERGFGFESDVLDMRMDRSASLSAYEVVNTYSFEKLRYILSEYGEIRQSAQLAQEIIRVRSSNPISSSKELSAIAKRIVRSPKKIHPATLLFQAIRIEVNDELGQIQRLLEALEVMRPTGAVVSLITFHSLEDRLVKRSFREWERSCTCDPQAPRCTCGNNHSLGRVITRKPLTASDEELRDNPRSRSAKLRTFIFGGKI